MSRQTRVWPCMLCDKLYAELEDAEACERRHGLEYDSHCGCKACRAERCRDTAMEVDRD